MQNSNSTSSGFFSTVKSLLFRKWVIMGAIFSGLVIIFLLFSAAWFGGGTKLSKIYVQYVERADRALMNDSLETALQLYFKALDIDDRQTTTYGKIAEGYFFAAMHHKKTKQSTLQQEMITQTKTYLNQGMEKDPANPYFDYIRGLLAMENNKTDSAVMYMALAETKGAQSFYLHFYLSDLYNEKEEIPLCLAQLLKAYEFKPNDQRVLYNLGEIYFQTGHYDQAITYQTKLIDLYPDIIDYKAFYAASLWKNGDEKTAKTIFNQVLHDQNNKDIYLNHLVAGTLIDRDIDYEWGIKVANIFAEIKGDPISYDMMGWGYFKLNQFPQAVHYLTLSYNKRPTADVKKRLDMAQGKLKSSGK